MRHATRLAGRRSPYKNPGIPSEPLSPGGRPVTVLSNNTREFARLSLDTVETGTYFKSKHIEKAIERLRFIIDEKNTGRRTDMAANFFDRRNTNWYKNATEDETKAALDCMLQLAGIMAGISRRFTDGRAVWNMNAKAWQRAGLDIEIIKAHATILGVPIMFSIQIKLTPEVTTNEVL